MKVSSQSRELMEHLIRVTEITRKTYNKLVNMKVCSAALYPNHSGLNSAGLSDSYELWIKCCFRR